MPVKNASECIEDLDWLRNNKVIIITMAESKSSL
jgi:hypothetical protein